MCHLDYSSASASTFTSLAWFSFVWVDAEAFFVDGSAYDAAMPHPVRVLLVFSPPRGFSFFMSKVEMTINGKPLNFVAPLKLTEDAIKGGIEAALFAIEMTVADTARRYCPISPTRSQLDDAIKARGGRPHKKRKGSSRPAPGGLARSISSKRDDTTVTIFIAEGSEGEKYANYIHNQKGVKWHKRGIGTVAKGPQADEKFIERAIADNEEYIRNTLIKKISRVSSYGTFRP